MKSSFAAAGLKTACIVALSLAIASPPLAHAQNYPNRPIRMIVPFSPGGAADTPGRMLMQKVSEALGQQVVFDNRPGAGGTIGAEAVAKAAPDGYTLLLISNTHLISASLYKNLSYDAITDFAPVLQFGDAPNVLVVNPSLPAKSVPELIALAKANPGNINYASSGNGSSQHLFCALFASMAGINMFHIPYKGSARATTELLSGEVKVGCPGIAGMMQYIKDGRLRALAVTGAERSQELPDVPTIARSRGQGLRSVSLARHTRPRGAAQGCDREAQHRYQGGSQAARHAGFIAQGRDRDRVPYAGGIREIPACRATEVVEGSQGDRLEG